LISAGATAYVICCVGLSLSEFAMSDEPRNREYWNAQFIGAVAGGEHSLWYEYMDQIYRGLVACASCGPSLKTDLFEEARSGRGPLRHLPGPAFGIDLSPEVVAAARGRLGGNGLEPRLVAADVRSLPFAPAFFRFILSGSTLDHFDSSADIVRSLRELARVLAPGGTLVMTLDNPHNPVLALRGRNGWMNRLRLDRYFVGATLTAEAGAAALRNAGFTVESVAAVAHAPRDPVMRAALLIDRWPGAHRAWWLRALMSLERLRDSRFAPRTGYYLAFRATRNAPPEGIEAPSAGEVSAS
jgi:SAM-dependent methyltransferase